MESHIAVGPWELAQGVPVLLRKTAKSSHEDCRESEHESHEDDLGPLMEQRGQQAGIPVKYLLPEMDALSGGDYRSYFLLCDNHWSAHGSAVAADILLSWLAYKATQ